MTKSEMERLGADLGRRALDELRAGDHLPLGVVLILATVSPGRPQGPSAIAHNIPNRGELINLLREHLAVLENIPVN